jgi:hypothetical protein
MILRYGIVAKDKRAAKTIALPMAEMVAQGNFLVIGYQKKMG